MPGTNIAISSETFNKASNKSWIKARQGLDVMRSITLDISTFAAEHIANGYIPSGIVLGKITATGKYGPYTPGTAEKQRITVDATGGTFTITFEGEATAAIAFNATAAAVQLALEELPGVAPGDITVVGGPGAAGGGTPYDFTFGQQYANRDIPAMTTNAASLTGGASTAAVTTPTAGGANAATDGTQVAAGHLFEEVKVTALTDPDCGAALFWLGIVDASKLPSFTGTGDGKGELDTQARVVLNRIRYE